MFQTTNQKIGLSENGGCPKINDHFHREDGDDPLDMAIPYFQPKLNIEIVLQSVFGTNLTSNQMFSADK